MKKYVTVKEAAILANRHISIIYKWISNGRINTYENSEGLTVLKSQEVLELEAIMIRKRNNKKPRKSA